MDDNYQEQEAGEISPAFPAASNQESPISMGLRFFTVPEIADLLQMKRERVYEAVRLGLVPAVHIGRQIRIEQKAFVDWVRDGGQTCAAGWRHQAS
jgi:excisionase family DNA binding protein